jgi:hypothetical protein
MIPFEKFSLSSERREGKALSANKPGKAVPPPSLNNLSDFVSNFAKRLAINFFILNYFTTEFYLNKPCTL